MAGESSHFYTTLIDEKKQDFLPPIEAAKYVHPKLPDRNEPYSFSIVYCASGYHIAQGYIYGNKRYGDMTICRLGGHVTHITIMNGEFKESVI